VFDCSSVGRRPELGGKVGQEYLRSLGSVDDYYGSLEVPRRHHVEMNVVVAQWMGRLKQMWLSEVVVGQVRLRQ
jgi:hypothetical protein